MPLYEYRCCSCRETFEALVFGGEQPECPECHSVELQRLMSLPAAPREETAKASCRSEGPPCGPVCGRWGK
ncbi:MAG: zinc ribbon domain-containing protein [Planctomycetes bacterium]|nr:zinc ribbon domain-containing protein [Planctomycetota bacterium]NBO91191.1 zinc ribbon domain-containing protein [Planctomycetia bacterium]